MKICDICGISDIDTRIIKSKFGTLCRKHYLQMYRHGEIKRTIYDSNIFIKCDDCIKIGLFNKNCELVDYAIINLDDYDLVVKYKWYARRGRHTTYAMTQINGKKIFLHRLILDYDGDADIDHINHNGLDNRRENLRIVPHALNASNSYKDCAGIKRVGNRFQAVVWDNYKQIYLGTFDTIEEAISARKDKLAELYGI